MYDVQWDLKGYDRAIAKMKALPVELRGKPGRSALGSAARIVTNAAKQNASKLDDPQTAEDISKNITQRFNTRYFKSTGDLKVRVGVMGGAQQYADTRKNRRKGRVGSTFLSDGSKGNPGGDTFYWRFVEFGTERAPAHPFMRPALADNTEKVTSVFAQKLEQQIDRFVKKYGI